MDDQPGCVFVALLTLSPLLVPRHRAISGMHTFGQSINHPESLLDMFRATMVNDVEQRSDTKGYSITKTVNSTTFLQPIAAILAK